LAEVRRSDWVGVVITSSSREDGSESKDDPLVAAAEIDVATVACEENS
jgi:hypothetical protein